MNLNFRHKEQEETNTAQSHSMNAKCSADLAWLSNHFLPDFWCVGDFLTRGRCNYAPWNSFVVPPCDCSTLSASCARITV